MLVERGNRHFENSVRVVDARHEQVLGRLEPRGQRNENWRWKTFAPFGRLHHKRAHMITVFVYNRKFLDFLSFEKMFSSCDNLVKAEVWIGFLKRASVDRRSASGRIF